MKKLLTPDKVYVGQSTVPNAGRGVFARYDIKKGEIIERCPVILIPKHDASNLKEGILITYFFFFGKDKKQLVIALGFGSIYNHSYKPNAIYKLKLKEKILEFTALTNIKKGGEVLVNYKYGNLKNTNPLWFEEDPR